MEMLCHLLRQKENGNMMQSEYNRLWLEEKLKDDDLYVCTTDTINGTLVYTNIQNDCEVKQFMKNAAILYECERQDHDFTIDDEDFCYYGLFTGREIREENEKHTVTFK